MNKPKILLLDIETSPNKAYVWGMWDQNIAHEQVIESSSVLCWSAKWLDRRGIIFESIQHQKPKLMLLHIHVLLGRADVVVHFNGLKFDIPTLNKEFIQLGFSPPAPYKQIDLLQVCRHAFRFNSNKMTNVTDTLGIGKKVKHEGFQLWVSCMEGNEQAWKTMERYNRQDVKLLEALYLRLRPWIAKHPNLGVYQANPACTNCGSLKVQSRGKEVALTQWYYRYQCQDCGRWFRGGRVTRRSR